MRYARVFTRVSNLDVIRRYLPANYAAKLDDEGILVYGNDSHGWTLDGYVIPRLASGNYYAQELKR